MEAGWPHHRKAWWHLQCDWKGGIGATDWEPDNTDKMYAMQNIRVAMPPVLISGNFKSYSIQPQKSSKEDKLRWHWNTPLVLVKKSLHGQPVSLSVNWPGQKLDTNFSGSDLPTIRPTKQEESGGLSADNTQCGKSLHHFLPLPNHPLMIQNNLCWNDDGNLQVTTNGGQSWKNGKAIAQTGVPAQTWISSIFASSHDPLKMIFATLDNHMYGDHQTM